MSLIPFVLTKNSVVLVGGDTALILMKATGVNVPMTVGLYDANFIASLLADGAVDEPSSSHLLKRILVISGILPTKIEITEICDRTFVAHIFLQKGDEEISLEAFPSDAVILALSSGVPMFIDERVIIEATESDQVQHLLSELEEQAPQTLES